LLKEIMEMVPLGLPFLCQRANESDLACSKIEMDVVGMRERRRAGNSECFSAFKFLVPFELIVGESATKSPQPKPSSAPPICEPLGPCARPQTPPQRILMKTTTAVASKEPMIIKSTNFSSLGIWSFFASHTTHQR
jgi:hypothetical protein